MTSTSRLSSLLVRDGLVRVGRMEHVFQRQVIYGGSLDTILLEMQLVDDSKLQQYLSLATGLPTANGSLQTEPSPELTKTCTRDLASKYHVVPLTLEQGSLAVLVSDPVDVAKLESLADEIDLCIQPMVVPEYQYRLSFARIFEEETDERFSKLAEQASTEGNSSTSVKQVPVVRIGERALPEDEHEEPEEKQVISPEPIDAKQDDVQAIPQAIEPEATQPADTSERVRGKRAPAEQPNRRQTQELNTDSLREHVEATMALAADAPKVVYDTPPETTTSQEQAPSKVVQDISALAENQATLQEPTSEEAQTEAADSTRPTVLMTAQTMPGKTLPRTAIVTPDEVARTEASAIDTLTPLTPDEARSLLDASEDRDEIFIILLRAMGRRARFVSLFTIKGNSANGRVSLSKAGVDREQIKAISINLDVSSRFQQVMSTKAFSVGSLNAEDEGVRAALALLGNGEIPKSALLLPVVMRDRVIAIAVAHNGDRGISVGKVTEILPLGTSTADAVSRLLAKMRAQKAAKASGAVPAAAVAAPAAPASEVQEDSSNKVPVPDAAMLELFSRIESDDIAVHKAACQEAIEQSDKAVAHLFFGFPGKLIQTREETTERIQASEHGPVLDLVTQLGPKCGPALSEKMRDADREVRYYATLCAAELRPSDVLNELVERLLDGDEKIRNLAVEALSGYPKDALHTALDFARRALHSQDNARVKLAADGLSKLEDTTAIPDLVDAHSRGGDAAEVSRRALLALTYQDFGNSTRKWRSWWEENQSNNQMEWMLEGLAHKNAEIRKNASEALRKLSGEYFGYGHDLPKKERDKTRKLWRTWWNDTGKERFR